MEAHHYISREVLSLEKIDFLVHHEGLTISLGQESSLAVNRCYDFLSEQYHREGNVFYGINTGFGDLCHIKIGDDALRDLQYHLIISHAAGLGDEVPVEIVKIMLLLKIQNLAYGYSGVSLGLVERLIWMYNTGIFPVIYQLGSLGASGDLAPLAHLSLPLIGLGKVWFKGEMHESRDLLNKFDKEPIQLHAKEGLALLNGTQFSSAYAVWSVLQGKKLLDLANCCAALSLDAFDCSLTPFDERIHKLRPHKGQIIVSEVIRNWLKDSEIATQEKHQVQDPYAFRCIPQVHGASYDVLEFVEKTILTEINSVTDNPSIFPDSEAILSGGNFHAQPVAYALDFLAIALAELGSISERRVFQLLSGKRGLLPFLAKDPGLHSGLMIPQYTAASIVSQNKQLCTPASIDSIVSSNGQEDHVSMASNAATKCYQVVQNLERLLAIEFLTATQALEARRPGRTSTALEEMLIQYRKVVPLYDDERVIHNELIRTIDFLRHNSPTRKEEEEWLANG